MRWRDPYDDGENEWHGVQAATGNGGGECLTVQSEKDNCDINVLVERLGIGEIARTAPPYDPRAFGDFTHMPKDPHEVLQVVRELEDAFMELPARVRERFENDPLRFYEFTQNQENFEEGVKLKIWSKREDVKPPEPPPPVVLADESIQKFAEELDKRRK